MSVLSKPTPDLAEVPELHNGDRMSQAEFHRIYSLMPHGFRAELLGGIVYVASPLNRRHGSYHPLLSTLFAIYSGNTPGTECGNNTTILLGEKGEPQPDLFLRVLPEHGGQSQTTDDDYVQGPPELLAEIAVSSRSLDLHAKYNDYARYGVLEYLVLNLRENRLHWFDLHADRELRPDNDGAFRIHTFPGLWIDEQSLLARETGRMLDVLNQGMTTSEHAEFVERLAAAAR